MGLAVEQPNKSSAKSWLVKLITGMSEDQCRQLLPRLEAWTQNDRREHTRKPCTVPVDYAKGEQAFKGFVKDISSGGVFIQTRGHLEIGEEITMTFSSPDRQIPVKIAGEIVRKDMLGIGVKFKQAMQDFEESTWIDCRRTIAEVNKEQRTDPRVEFQCPVQIEGVQGETIITDISLGGIFVECQPAIRERFQPGESIGLLMKLPTEDKAIRAKARVVNFSDRGMHCKFVNLNRTSEEAIQHCFNVAKHTLPIR